MNTRRVIVWCLALPALAVVGLWALRWESQRPPPGELITQPPAVLRRGVLVWDSREDPARNWTEALSDVAGERVDHRRPTWRLSGPKRLTLIYSTILRGYVMVDRWHRYDLDTRHDLIYVEVGHD